MKTEGNEVNISVVIPTYRRAHLLKICLGMICHQTFSGTYEIIVVSDGKDEETATWISDFIKYKKANLIYTSLTKKSGPAAARNLGWQTAKGELILFTDDDTQPSFTWLQNYWNAYLENGKKEIAFTGKVNVPLAKSPTDFERNTAGLETADFVTANCACTRVALQQIEGFDEAFTMAWREDSEFEFKLLNADIPIKKVEAAVVLHPVRKATWGVSLREQKKSMFNALLYKKHPALFRKKIMVSPIWNYYAMIVLFLTAVVLLFFGLHVLSVAFFCCWLLFEMAFISIRLHNNSHSLSHVLEMVFTSLLIPFLSVYWTLFGAIKFKVFFL